MKLKAFAKINLMLDIFGKTEDGYHDLFMIMQSVGIADIITVTLSGEDESITLSCSKKELPCDEHNIAYKAAQAFFNEARGKDGKKIANPGIHIDIEKHIPFAAGLAGGSADAAGVLTALNCLCGAELSVEELCRIGVKVGADVPFCLKGGTMAAFDIGEVLAPLPPVRGDYYVLVKPKQDVSTKAAYDAFDTASGIKHPNCAGMLRSLATANCEKAYGLIGNVFEQFVDVPDRVDIKACMRRHHTLAHCMSGSGPTVYGIFDNEIRARSCAAELSENYDQVFVCNPVPHGVEIIDNQ